MSTLVLSEPAVLSELAVQSESPVLSELAGQSESPIEDQSPVQEQSFVQDPSSVQAESPAIVGRTYLEHQIRWEKLPDDFILPKDPVDNINQPHLAAALTESLRLADRLPELAFTCTDYGMCVTFDGQIVVKAPDWAYVAQIKVSRDDIDRSYTPELQGDRPTIVLEFLSDTPGEEYSIKETYPPGKFYFYEQILKVPTYGILDLQSGAFELYQLNKSGSYKLKKSDENDRYWIPELSLFLGSVRGTRDSRTGYWLRWWDEAGNLLLWGEELMVAERQRTEAERQRAEAEHQRAEAERQRAEEEHQRAEAERERADRLLAQLKAAGIDPLE